jgi:hypothetical protein
LRRYGEVRIGQYDNLDLKPTNWNNATLEFSLSKDLSYGLGVSVGAEFVGERSTNFIESGYIDFSSIGAYFTDPRLIIAKQPESVFSISEYRHPHIP